MHEHLSATDFPWPLPDEAVRAALDAAYRDGSWGRYDGPHSAGLKEDLGKIFASPEVLLCASGTVAVELALRGCGVGPSDEVVLAGYDFPGNFRAIEAVGALPILVDVDPESWSLDAHCLAQVTGPRIRAVIVSHLHGGLADMPMIMQLARERGWLVVEDACQQPGAMLGGRPVGSWGDVGVLSFGGSKLLTAGRGGALVTGDRAIHQRAKIFAQRGNDAFPLSELQATVLRPQLARLADRNRQRAGAVTCFLEATAPLTAWLRAVTQPENSQPAYYKLAWSYLPAEQDQASRTALTRALDKVGLPMAAGFRGFARRGRTGNRCRQVGALEHSWRLSRSTLLLHHPILLAPKGVLRQAGDLLAHIVRRMANAG